MCISGDLVSDLMSVNYVITMPSPDAPNSNLGPGTYDKPRSVKLRIMGEDQNVQLYYTIDGTQPTIDSPQYTGEAIKMPTGRVTLRAVAVNQYGKVSNEYNVLYKFGGNVKKYFRADIDNFDDFTLHKTSYEAFVKKFGAPDKEDYFEDEAISGECLRLTYDWGEALFNTTEDGRMVYAVTTTSAKMTGPRKTGVGKTLDDVTNKYRDVGQLANAKGDRSVYYDADVGYARITNLGNDQKTLVYLYKNLDQSTVTLTYYLTKDKVEKVSIAYHQ